MSAPDAKWCLENPEDAAREIIAQMQEVERLRDALHEIACHSQSKDLLWWQIAARRALGITVK